MSYPPQGLVNVGERGEPGESIKGDRGDRGESIKGNTGERGEKGETGESVKGDKGDSIKGDKGDKGEAGKVVNMDAFSEGIREVNGSQAAVLSSLVSISLILGKLVDRLEVEHVAQENQRRLERNALEAITKYLESSG